MIGTVINYRMMAWGFAALALAAVLGWEADWGTAFEAKRILVERPKASPVAPELLGDFVLPGGIAAYAETTKRPVMVPTRLPAPAATAPQGRALMVKGQFVLVGTVLSGGKNYALLRESNGGKQLRVAQGDRVREMVVSKVEPKTVVLAQDEESEILVLKTSLVAGPAVMPAALPAQNPPNAAAGKMPGGAPVPTTAYQVQKAMGNRRDGGGEHPADVSGRAGGDPMSGEDPRALVGRRSAMPGETRPTPAR